MRSEATLLHTEIFNRYHRLEALGVEFDFEALKAALKAARETNQRKYSS